MFVVLIGLVFLIVKVLPAFRIQKLGFHLATDLSPSQLHN